jgi:hypothetical protein
VNKRIVILLFVASTGCKPPSAPAAPPPAPPSRACTEIGCGPAFGVEFQRAAGWGLGVYRIELQVDGETVSCERQIPLHCDEEPACSRADVQLVEIGCALDVSQQSLGGVQFVAEGPAQVSVRVRHDDTELGTAEYAPQYTESRPNGPDCEPVCRQAKHETLVLGSPAPR